MNWLALSFLFATWTSPAASTRITDISGISQRTPMLGQTVNLTALVTAKGKSGFYLLGDPVKDSRVSNGLAVFTTSTTILAQVTPGDIVSLIGKVSEFRPAADPDYLLLTELTSPANITVLSSNNTVTPLILGKDRSPPTQQFSPLDVGRDGWLSVPNNQSRIDVVNGTLHPDAFGIDFWASLLGQIVAVPKPVAINFPNSFGEFWAHGDWPVTGKNSRGGLSLTFGPHGIPDANPEAILIGAPLDGTKNPKTAIGTTLSDIVGVITYQFGYYYVLPLTAPTVITSPSTPVSPTTLVSSDLDHCAITVGDYNVENMAPTGGHVLDVANHIANMLATPDIMFIQEVQDNSGPTDDGVVSANVTLSNLVSAIAKASNVTYSWVEIDPVDKEDGGQPGGNIRQAYLYRPEKLQLVRAPGLAVGGALNATEVIMAAGKPFLNFNPGRVDPANAAWQDSRKPLAAMWTTASGHTLFTVNLHLVSKGGSTTGHGDARPPVNLPVDQRTNQVETVATFVKSILDKDRHANIVVAGDCNEYIQTRSVWASLTPLLDDIDEVADIPPVERYTYVFDNNCEQLDHMFVSPALSSRCAEVEHIHVNNWAPTVAARVSDHDPTVARIRQVSKFMAEYSHLSDPDPEFAPYMAQMMAIPQLFEVEARRKRFKSVFIETSKKSYASALPNETEYRLTDHQVDVENGKILVRSLIPTSKKGSDTYPLMVWMHGGGWTSGNLELDDYQLRAICVELQISILNVDYRLAPEHPHPTGLNDSYSALKWAAESSELLCADLKKGFIISGLSAGGHIAAIIAHRARDDPFFKEKKLTGSLLQIPAVLNPNAVPDKYKSSLLSYEQNKHGPGLTTSSILWSFGQLGGDPADPEVSPLLYQSHKGLVPTVIQACGLDPLRDEALLYDKLLKDEGVKTRTITYPGVPHAFQYAFPAFKIAIKWEEDYRAALRWLLDGAPPE